MVQNEKGLYNLLAMSTKSGGRAKKNGGLKVHDAPRISAAEDAAETPPPPPASLDHLGDLPHSYGLDTIFLVAQEPRWLFTYWDIDITRHPGGKTFLRVLEGPSDGEIPGKIESQIEVPFETRNWYIPVQHPGTSYVVEIGYFRGDAWHVIARSLPARTPPEGLSSSEQFEYATIPMHISFQKLMENIKTALANGEPLTQALGRLQREGKLFSFGLEGFPLLPNDQRLILEGLLGPDFLKELSSQNLSSQGLESKIRQRLEEKLDSQGASELLAGGGWSPGESSLFSALGSLAGSAPTSWASGELTTWTAQSLSSWAAAALSSWLSAAGAASSWSTETLASWSGAASSSWSTASLSSWTAASLSSWGGASENLSSFGFPSREFFLHVNAEVIFYGGTDPRAKVTIDGKPVKLNPDGTFRYHFIFPDGAYKIPISAISPDGVETRSAALRFERSTTKTGHVTDTPQPILSTPFGARS